MKMKILKFLGIQPNDTLISFLVPTTVIFENILKSHETDEF